MNADKMRIKWMDVLLLMLLLIVIGMQLSNRTTPFAGVVVRWSVTTPDGRLREALVHKRDEDDEDATFQRLKTAWRVTLRDE